MQAKGQANMQAASLRTWKTELGYLTDSSDVFGPEFMAVYGDREWSPNASDRLAAHAMHVELISRIATQSLGYGDGVVERALGSLAELFGHARNANGADLDCGTFETIVWHVLNERLRPFTARWHGKAKAGVLDALDASDEFRAELEVVQRALTVLDVALRLIRNVEGYAPPPPSTDSPPPIDPLEDLARWRPMGVDPNVGSEHSMGRFVASERTAIRDRRSYYDEAVDRDWAAGIALSGGGIRSASFSIGVLTSLAKRNVLPRFDYLSTVSGGGYAGAFLTHLLGHHSPVPDYGLRSTELPFRREEGEADILRRLRQNAGYLSGGVSERANLAFAHASAILVNLLALSVVAAFVSLLDSVASSIPMRYDAYILATCAAVLAAVALGRPIRRSYRRPATILTFVTASGRFAAAVAAVVLLLQLLRMGTRILHGWWRPFSDGPQLSVETVRSLDFGSMLGGAIGVVASLLLVVALVSFRGRGRAAALTIMIGVLFFLLEGAAFDVSRALDSHGYPWVLGYVVLVSVYLVFLLRDVDVTSLHDYYRRKLRAAFFLAPDEGKRSESVMPEALSTSEVDPCRALFPILNCAVNLPGSRNKSMRGRMADVFSITPVATGATILGYEDTEAWERANPGFDLADAMALSGSAVSPQSGSTTTRYASFWLTLLNFRLGAWRLRPGWRKDGSRPGVRYLLREATATADEKLPFVRISDGGHIENLGVYELLRRRCRYIVAVDGENDPEMTFHGLTNLQRLAYIDFGIVLELDLDDLRIGATGYSRSHFRFCRIRYPKGDDDADAEIGYLAYLKLSLTGNEGEFLRRVRLDEPAFPHHSTADQFFSETRFEAYRALGEHVGEKMFLPAIVGQIGNDVTIQEWFERMGTSLLDRRTGSSNTGTAPSP